MSTYRAKPSNQWNGCERRKESSPLQIRILNRPLLLLFPSLRWLSVLRIFLLRSVWPAPKLKIRGPVISSLVGVLRCRSKRFTVRFEVETPTHNWALWSPRCGSHGSHHGLESAWLESAIARFRLTSFTNVVVAVLVVLDCRDFRGSIVSRISIFPCLS